jgi:hypothetical protein
MKQNFKTGDKVLVKMRKDHKVIFRKATIVDTTPEDDLMPYILTLDDGAFRRVAEKDLQLQIT